jgi:tetratricopeptide (TPR) repeat protein
VRARYNLGHAYLEADDPANAELWFRRTIEVGPRYTPALNELGRLATRRNAFDESIAFYLAAIETAPTYAVPHFNVAQLYERAGERAAARRHYELFLQFAGPEHTGAVASVRAKLAAW